MKLIIKTLKQMSYNVEIPSENSTVLDLKKELEKLHGFDASLLKLLFNGVILEDSKTLQEYKIQENSIIIMMSSKGKPKNNNPPSNNEPPKQKEEEKKPEEKKPEQKNEQKPQEEKYTQQMSSLLDMGFEKTQAEAAIKAARGQIDLAIEFLYNGIPEGINDNMDDLNMDEGQEEGEEEGEGDNSGEDPIKTVASVAKVLCQNNPGALTELLQSIQQTDPDLLNLLNEHEDEFKELLSQPITESDYRAFRRYGQNMGIGGEGEEEQHEHHEHGGDQGQITISLTPEEQEAIKRLKDLGNFSEADVVQAYIACEKNEELTANYLFEQKMRDDDEMFGGNNNNNNGNGQ